MTSRLGKFFTKKLTNEPFLALDDLQWEELEGGYKGVIYNPSFALKRLEQANDIEEVKAIYKELWDELHHQGDIGLASYYAVPHMVRIALETQLVDYNVLALVSVIEIQRAKNVPVPELLFPAYNDALSKLMKLATIVLAQDCDFNAISVALTAIAIAKGEVKLAKVIQNLDSVDVLDEFLEMY